jgi:hypothetical protein
LIDLLRLLLMLIWKLCVLSVVRWSMDSICRIQRFLLLMRVMQMMCSLIIGCVIRRHERCGCHSVDCMRQVMLDTSTGYVVHLIHSIAVHGKRRNGNHVFTRWTKWCLLSVIIALICLLEETWSLLFSLRASNQVLSEEIGMRGKKSYLTVLCIVDHSRERLKRLTWKTHRQPTVPTNSSESWT